MGFFLIGAGCVSVPAPQVKAPAHPGSSYLLHLPGVAGVTIFDQWWLQAMIDEKVIANADFYDWTGKGRSWIDVLQSVDRNRATARTIAGFLAQVHQTNPDGQLIVSSESGGVGIAIWTLESLPPDVMVDDVLLIAPSVSSHYDLTAALRHVRGTMYYSTSPADGLTNALGTLTFGTIDGKHVPGAGLVGFHRPGEGDPTQYKKLVEIPYNPAWIIWGNLGLHTGGMSASFARHVLAPMLIRDEHRLLAQHRQPPIPRQSDSPSRNQPSLKWVAKTAEENGRTGP